MTTERALIPVDQVKDIARAAVASKLFPSLKNESEAFTLMMLAQAEGCHPIQAMQRYHIVQGRPAKAASAMLADFQLAGGKVRWIERGDAACEAEFFGPGLAEGLKVRWTIEQAQRAGIASKDSWKKYPRQMLSARVISEGVGLAWAGARSLYTPEEVQDFDDKPQYTPPPKQEAPAPQSAEPPQPKATPAQLKALFASLGAAGIRGSDDQGAWVREMARERFGLALKSSRELTREQASTLIAAAKNGEVPATREPGQDDADPDPSNGDTAIDYEAVHP